MAWNKPLPHPTPISQPWWDALKAHELHLQRCDQGHWFFFPRQHCPVCGSRQVAWHPVSGQGTLYSFTVARVPTLPEFTDEMPQLLAVVELDEGPRLNTTLVGVAPEAIRIGQRLRPVFDDRPGEVTLLRYTPVESDHPEVIGSEPAAEPTQAPAPAAAEPPKRRISCKDLATMRSLVSTEFSGWSNTFEVTQALIDQFAALTGDDYWIHTDPDRARRDSPFGTTIAHGALVQVLASRLKMPMDFEIVDFVNIVNYGSDRLRFAAPVPSGCRIHGRYRITRVEQVKSGVQVTMEIDIHVVGQDRPSVVNDLVMLYM
ncbi:MAG TPA: OB-fold domain-containing protein [Burkholderiaceae bacterium]|nr:OB-fold domain-containing protein [Burkholderiaceae bacterium]HMZ00813.1 OB-fold domain-containing protein [Burkholderiaceae bacterium]HNB45534.1 OB-fold domain-containing protein [Burkholderiaceae bacterium]HNG78138.1 OB-fold domain-containing protein [Burkholderiaceae bacterium]